MTDHSAKNKYQPVLLLPNVSYPTYQLFAEAGNGKTSPENVLKIVVLTTFDWLRQRFRAFEVPDELKTQAVSDYEKVDPNEFKTFSLNKGYKVEVVWLSQEKAWTLQLIEPDLGSDPGQKDQKRYPVPGRLFETNIAYQIKGDKVICGFNTVVSDPINTEAKAEVFRLAIIKRLVRHELVQLKHFWPIVEHAHILDKKPAIDQLASCHREKNRLLPLVIAVESSNKEPAITSFNPLEQQTGIDPLIQQMTQEKRFHNILSLENTHSDSEQFTHKDTDLSKETEPAYTINIDDLARHKVGFALFFKLPLEQLGLFNKITNSHAKPGEILLCEPYFISNKVPRFTPVIQKSDAGELYKEIERIIGDFPRDKEMRFESIMFMSDAKLKYHEMIISISSSKEEIIKSHEEINERINQKYKDKISSLANKLEIATEKYKRQQDTINDYKQKKKDHQDDIAVVCRDYEEKLSKKEKELDRLKMRKQSPRCLADLDKWVKESFTDRLVFHSRACDMIRDIQDSEVELPLLCDALEFLAFEYRDCLLGKINETEKNNICSQTYNRPFDVSYNNDDTIEKYPQEYKIKYFEGRNGKLLESPLNLHLRVGNKSENLLRIYFLYDKDKKLIVIGSLPKHLRTISYH